MLDQTITPRGPVEFPCREAFAATLGLLATIAAYAMDLPLNPAVAARELRAPMAVAAPVKPSGDMNRADLQRLESALRKSALRAELAAALAKVDSPHL